MKTMPECQENNRGIPAIEMPCLCHHLYSHSHRTHRLCRRSRFHHRHRRRIIVWWNIKLLCQSLYSHSRLLNRLIVHSTFVLAFVEMHWHSAMHLHVDFVSFGFSLACVLDIAETEGESKCGFGWQYYLSPHRMNNILCNQWKYTQVIWKGRRVGPFKHSCLENTVLSFHCIMIEGW